jgi:hypothetical protein
MIPIGIVTRNRPEYLDVTLRSLAGAATDAEERVIVFDDASDTPSAREYLYTPRTVRLGPHAQERECWKTLGVMNVAPAIVHGIGGRIEVVRLGSRPLGVVNASCAAICRLFARHPQAAGIFLLQDDVVFKADWQQRMREAAELTAAKLPGLLAGMTLLRRPPRRHASLSSERFVTAQCLFLHRDAFSNLSDWLCRRHDASIFFDTHLCREVRSRRLAVHLLHPFVCQHIGIRSLVHPEECWLQRGPRGRIGYEASPPYALAGEVPRGRTPA